MFWSRKPVVKPNYRLINEDDVISMKNYLGSSLEVDKKVFQERTWSLDECKLMDPYDFHENEIYGFNTWSMSWDYLDTGSYIHTTYSSNEGGLVQFYSNITNVVIDDEGKTKHIGDIKFPVEHYLEVYIEETLFTNCNDPKMRVAFFV